jgi:hypothetical protein
MIPLRQNIGNPQNGQPPIADPLVQPVFPKSAVDYLGQAEFRHNANQQGDVIYSLMVKLQFTVHPPTIAQNS